MSKKKPIVKTCAKCKKPFSTADDSIIFCRACLDEKVKAEARAEIERQAQVVETKECPGCHKKFDVTVGEKEYMEAHGMNPSPRFCKECRKVLRERKGDIGKEVTCTDCGKTFKMSALSVLNSSLHGWELTTRCPECRKKAAEAAKAAREARKPSGVYKTLTCKDCGKEFAVTNGEHQFLVNHGCEFDPVRCKECRHKRKVQAVINDMRSIADSDAMPGEASEMDVDTIGQQVGDPNVVPADTMQNAAPDTTAAASIPETAPDTSPEPADEDVGMDAKPNGEPVWEGDAPIPAQAVDWAAENAPEFGEPEEKPSAAWAEEEVAILKRAFSTESVEIPSRLPKVDHTPVKQQAAQLGVGWTAEELPEHTPAPVTRHAVKLGTQPDMAEPEPSDGIARQLPGRPDRMPAEQWTAEVEDILRAQYAETDAAAAGDAPGNSDNGEGMVFINEAGKDPNAFTKAEDDLDGAAMNLSAAPAEVEDVPAAESSTLAVDAEKVAELTKGLYPQDGEQTAAVDVETEAKDKKPGFFGKLFGARD